MDFASGLANLEQTAANAQNRRRGRDDKDNNAGGESEDHRRFQPRPRRGYETNNNHVHNNRGGGGGGGRGRGRGRGDERNDYYGGGGRHHQQQRSPHQQPHHQHDRSLDGFSRFGYRLPRGPYHRPPPISANSDRPLHICLLAISIDDLPYEHIWKAWAASTAATTTGDKIRVSLVCHAKHPEKVQSEWLKQRMLLQPRRIARGNSLSDPEFLSHKPAWGSVEITRAMIDLLVQGMDIGRKGDASKANNADPRFSANRFLISTTPDNDNDPNKSAEDLVKVDVPPCDKFIFCSETCIPVTTLEECCKALFDTTTRTTISSTSPAAAPGEGSTTSTKSETQAKESSEPQEEGVVIEEPSSKPVDLSDTTTTSQQDEKPNESNSNNKEKPSAGSSSSSSTDRVIYLDTSWVNARNFNSPNTPQNKYERDQFNGIHRVIPKHYRWKADQWMVLSRTHAAAILDLDHTGGKLSPKDHLWNSFRRINASDEMYFPTALALAGILIDATPRTHHRHQQQHQQQQGPPSQQSTSTTTEEGQQQQQQLPPWLQRRRVTYTDWSMGMRNPATFTNGIKDFANIARVARQQKCLFARKFAPFLEIPGQDPSTIDRKGDISVDEWFMELNVIRQADGAIAHDEKYLYSRRVMKESNH